MLEGPTGNDQDPDGKRDEAMASSAAEIARQSAPELDRLPPPAFPPGERRGHVQRREGSFVAGSMPDRSFPEDAFISPDEPVRRIGTEVDDALISPDDPIQRRSPRDEEFSAPTPEDDEEAGGIVTGIGSEGPLYLDAGKLGSWDPEGEIGQVASTLERLAAELREKGGTALLINPDNPPLESTIRGLLAGFLLRDG